MELLYFTTIKFGQGLISSISKMKRVQLVICDLFID